MADHDERGPVDHLKRAQLIASYASEPSATNDESVAMGCIAIAHALIALVERLDEIQRHGLPEKGVHSKNSKSAPLPSYQTKRKET